MIMNTFDKENFDVAKIFLAYLTFLGNPTKVGIALHMQPEVVEVLAAREDWPAKLRVYLGLRHSEALAELDASIRRTATYIVACQLREIIQRLINQVYRLTDHEGMMAFFSPVDPRTNRPRFNPNILVSLYRAFGVVSRIISREGRASDDDPEEPRVKERVTIHQAVVRANCAMDLLPGIDSVDFARDSLEKWGAQPEETQNNEYMI
jgi:hypothetical protein